MTSPTPQAPALENVLRALLDNLAEGVLLMDRGGVVQALNRAAAAAFALAPEQLLGASMRSVISPMLASSGAGEASPCPIVATLGDGQTRQFSDRLTIADGRCTRVHVVVACVRDGDAIAGAMLIISNLDEQERTHTALAHLNAQLTALIEALPDAIVFKDGYGRWEIANQMAKTVFRLDAIDWPGKTDRELAELNPELQPEHQASLDGDAAAWQAATLFTTTETVCVGIDERPFEVRRLPLFDGEQRRALVVIGRDVGQRVALERELRIAATVFATHDAILVLDAHLRIVRVNAAFIAQTGYDAAEVTGGGTEFLRSGFHTWDFRSQVVDRIQRTGFARVDTWVRRKNGEVYPARVLTSRVMPEHSSDAIYFVSVISDLSEQRKTEHALQYLASNDPLTGLPNREHFFTELDARVLLAADTKRWSALLLLDLDRFKHLNESYGHQAGDAMLHQCRDRIRACLPAHSLLSRLGGDEFAMVINAIADDPHGAATAAEGMARAVRGAVAAPVLLLANTAAVEMTASVGIRLFEGREGDAQHLLKQAEIALYRAKADGRNCERMFVPSMQAQVTSGLAIDTALRDAITGNAFCHYYQPIVDAGGAVHAHEALLRWDSASFGQLTPDAFLPRLRDAGLLPRITAWGVNEVCAHVARQRLGAPASAQPVALNIDASMFRQPDFVELVSSAVRRHGIDGRLLTLELTEHVLFDDVTATAQKMQQLRAIGVSFALDDFGTGYSSLRYLKMLPISQIKIDQSFVLDMFDDPHSNAIIDALLAMAAALGLEVVAEGIETQAQFTHLASKGCRLFQGHWLGRPRPERV